MRAVLEGIDGAGKSTLSNYIIDKYNFGYQHSDANTKNDFDYHYGSLVEKDYTVFDRFHIGEVIYPIIYKRDSKLTNEEWYKINDFIVENGFLVIFSTSDFSIIEERLKLRGEDSKSQYIEWQNRLFREKAEELINHYGNDKIYLVDIAEENCYGKLYSWVDEKINSDPNIVYRQICRDLLEKGHPLDSKLSNSGNSRELCNYMFTIHDVKDRIIDLKTRNVSYPYLAGETLWYWNARNDVEFISKFGKMWSRLTDDGVTNNSAYGYILKEKHGFNQIEKIIELLKYDPYTRRAVLNINVPNENVITTHDEMCTICLNFQIRNNKLNCTAVMRSNDIIYGLSYDYSYFTLVQKYIAEQVGVEIGDYTHIALSLHFYDKDYELVKSIAYGPLDKIEEKLDVDKLLEYNDELIDYIDNHWVDKKEFKEELKKREIIK